MWNELKNGSRFYLGSSIHSLVKRFHFGAPEEPHSNLYSPFYLYLQLRTHSQFYIAISHPSIQISIQIRVILPLLSPLAHTLPIIWKRLHSNQALCRASTLDQTKLNQIHLVSHLSFRGKLPSHCDQSNLVKLVSNLSPHPTKSSHLFKHCFSPRPLVRL